MQEALTFGRFRLLPAARILYRGDQRLKVGSRALEILLALAERAGDLVSKQELAGLDGIPLAIEFAAARVRAFGAKELLTQLGACPRIR